MTELRDEVTLQDEVKTLRDEVKSLQEKNHELLALIMVGFQGQSVSWNELVHLKAVKESTRRELDSVNEFKNITYAEMVSLKSAILRLNDKNSDLEHELARREILWNSYNKHVTSLETSLYYGSAMLFGMMIADFLISTFGFFKKK